MIVYLQDPLTNHSTLAGKPAKPGATWWDKRLQYRLWRCCDVGMFLPRMFGSCAEMLW